VAATKPAIRPAVDATASCRLLIDLTRVGWEPRDIADAAGVTLLRLRRVPLQRWVPALLADRIRAAHDELLTWPAEPRYLDPVAVRRLMAGEPPAEYTRDERREAVRRLRGQGMSLSEITAILGVYERMITRDLTALRRAGAVR